MPGAWGTTLGTGKQDGEQLALPLLQRTRLYNLESRRKTPNNQMISQWGHALKGTIGAAVGMYMYVWGASRDRNLLGAVKKGLPEDMALELRAEGPAGPHGVKAGLGRHALRRGNRLYEGPEQMQKSQSRWGPERMPGMRQGLRHAGSRRFL